MKPRGLLVLVLVASTAFLVAPAGTSSATSLCRIPLPECAFGNDLPVPEAIEAKMTTPSLLFSQPTETACEATGLELETTSNTGFGQPLLAEIVAWKFNFCGVCSSVTALGLPYEAELEALQDGSPATFRGNGILRILSPEFKLSGCPGGLTCIDSAGEIAFKVVGGGPMRFAAGGEPMNVGGASCGSNATFEAEYSEALWKKLWLEPVP